jgi:16S rRNA (cytosine967-C5)-methyltransferase
MKRDPGGRRPVEGGRMGVDAGRVAAFQVLRALERGASWEAAWRRAGLGPAARALDRRFARELASGTLRLRGRLDWILMQHARRPLAALDRDVHVLLRLGAYQLFEVDRVGAHAAVHQTVELAKRWAPQGAGFVNAVLRSALRGRQALAFPDRDRDPLGYLEAAASHPRWLLERWLERFGLEETEALCAYDNRRPDLCLRANPARTTPAALRADLPGSVPGRWSEAAVRCPGPAWGAARRAVLDGRASVQDESGMLVAPQLRPRPGQELLDLAAAPGGKTCHLAELLEGTGVVRAYDRTPAKVQKVRENAARLGLANVLAAVGDARKLHVPPADGVLLDAPCSGLGVLARRPDLRWRKRPDDLPRLQALQLELLEAAARHVRPGGLLVYSLCSFEPEETLEVVERFGARHAELRLDDEHLPPALRAAPGVLYFFPQRHGIDGGFVARWRRVS